MSEVPLHEAGPRGWQAPAGGGPCAGVISLIATTSVRHEARCQLILSECT